MSLRRFLRHRLTLDQARQIVRERMERREENFLQVVERSVYHNPRSPYLALLKMAGCELDDIRGLVKQKGLEGALRVLREEGVYVTFEEFKGRTPIVRNGRTIPVMARDFDNPSLRRDFSVATGGSTGAAISVGVNFDGIAAAGVDELLRLSTIGVLGAPIVRWAGILPSSTLRTLLREAHIGQKTERWFSNIGLRDSKHWLKYGAATFYILYWIRLNGVRVPWPEFVRPDQAEIVARCVAGLVQVRKPVLVQCNVSLALRVCVAAERAGLDLRGALFTGTAEPTTPGKVLQIERAGVRYIPFYSMVEASMIGAGCPQPAEVGDVHLFKDAFALFTYDYPVKDLHLTVPAFNLTTLLPTAAKVMLNVQMDDYGVVEERPCGCEFDNYGFTTHLSGIRSYSKLTGEGVTLIGNEIVRILEEVLPARFGGTPLDYQLSEQEDEKGFTRLYLLISPGVKIEDEQKVVQVMLDALGASSPMADVARAIWQQARTVQVKRMAPILTTRGKLMPLHIERRTQNS